MIRLVEIDERNFFRVRQLKVGEDQQRFLDSPLGILARGYVYRAQRARVLAAEKDGEIVGLMLVKDMDEEPACYDLQQFMIDRRFQGRGFGTEALWQLLALLEREGRYPCVEVCVHHADAPALRVYEKIGFADTGYVDESCPDCLNLMFYFR